MRRLYLLSGLLPLILFAFVQERSQAQNFQVITLTSSRALGGASIAVPPSVTSVRVTVRVPGNLITGSGTTGNCGNGDNRVDLRLCPPNAGCQGVTVQAGQGQGLNICHQFEETLGPFTILNPPIPCTSFSFNAVTEQVSTATVELFGASCGSTVQPFQQTDSEWASQTYDGCPDHCSVSPGNIGKLGCGLTALAMALRTAGIDRLPSPSGAGTVALNPGTLNTFLQIAGGGSGYEGPLVSWETATALVNQAWSGIIGQPTQWRFSDTRFDSTSAGDLFRILCSGGKNGQPSPVILKVAGPAGKSCASGGCTGHFVLATGVRPDGRIEVIDPSDGQTHVLDPCDPSQGEYGSWSGHSSHWYLRGAVVDPDDLSALVISITGPATIELVAGAGSKNKHVDELGDDFGTSGEPPLTVVSVEQPPTGHFSLQVIGTGSGPYHLTVRAIAADGSIQPKVSFDGSAQSGQVQDFGIDFSSEPGRVIHLIPADAVPPALAVMASPAILQANNELAPVTVAVQVSDNTDSAPVVRLESITCDDACEPANDISGATLNSDDRQFLLRAKRSDSGPGRAYTIVYSATDAAGNVARATTIVRVPQTLFLHGSSGATLFLDGRAPVDPTPRYADSAAVRFSGGNPWTLIGSWSAAPSLTNAALDRPGSLDVWLGLKNSDDQGTRFDLRAEIYRNGTLVTAGEVFCITGVTRNPSAAQQATLSLPSAPGITFNGTSDALTLRILTRIGTTGGGGLCGGHSNAVGLRLYFDGGNRSSRLLPPF